MTRAKPPKVEKGRLEAQFAKLGPIAGVDEVGRGCLAGPVYAAAAILCPDKLAALPTKTKGLIRDSKKLSAKQRQLIVPILEEISIANHIGIAKVEEIEGMGIVPATFLAMRRALTGLGVHKPAMVLVDGNKTIPEYKGQQQSVIKGDSSCYNIAAASILAKVARDTFMHKQAALYPDYGFENHVGYGTKQHLEAIFAIGICKLHRRNFAPIKNMFAEHP